MEALVKSTQAIEKAIEEISCCNNKVSHNTTEVACHTEAVARNTRDMNTSHNQVMTAVAVIQGDIGGLKKKVGKYIVSKFYWEVLVSPSINPT